ncbi:STAS domain-containing protein [Conexibacter woesei]|uniref:STAS domain-containing protein n=1 Tax=Conexibacter woesei TaxID=191495 RepID=UPI0012DEB4DD|nr:STAS domain-containing protein [Conexibacter woesei]
MAGDPQFGPAPDHGARRRRAVTPQPPRDPVALREAMEAALAADVGTGATYRDVLRPFLAAVGDAGGGPAADDRRAVARSAAQAALAELSAVLPTSDEGLGRRAAVLAPAGVIGELDSRALADVLDAGGWSTQLIGLDREAGTICDEVLDARVELLVLPVADAAQVLASQRALSLIRRLNAPPLIVGVTFASMSDASAAVAADHVVGDTDALPSLLHRRLGGGGPGAAVPWGVRMHRDGTTLVVAPFGVLDDTTVGRLREIVETRRTLYPAILIDLRELDSLSTSGLTALSTWSTETPWPPTVSALRDTRTTTALSTAGLSNTIPFAQPAA